ncbi:uncharacterized protein LOC116012386 [Ipomoea triloba]|uniref:uncharacterized protein LOC116012386 n=1 Tax=Ipomoea triloba TaxID=35885 RepID=UPI00125D3785|nr:uncharacterized protein LOC116012386 [Ipomoea triloba]
MDLQPTSPLLMISVEEETLFVSLNGDKAVPKLKKNSPKYFKPIGSSHGWLILLDENSEPYLLNPFNQSKIQLPKKISFPHINSITSKWFRGGECLFVEYTSGFTRWFDSTEDKSPLLSIKKAVLSANPSTHKDFVVAVIYGEKSRIAYCRNVEMETRSGVQFRMGILTHTMILHVLMMIYYLHWEKMHQLKFGGFDVFWFFYTAQEKGHNYSASISNKVFGNHERLSWNTLCQEVLLSPLSGQIFFIVRCVGEFVITDGGNHSVSMLVSDHSELKGDSIYFTDDYWDRMDEDYLYGGHDMGVFSLKDERVDEFFNIDLQKITPPPFWLVPKLLNIQNSVFGLK